MVVQIADKHKAEFKKIMDDAGVGYLKLGHPTDERLIQVTKDGAEYQFGIDYLRDVWYSTSYLLDRKQSMNGRAKARFENYKMQPLEMVFNKDFTGKLAQYGLNPDRRIPSDKKAPAQPLAEPNTSELENPPQKTIILISSNVSRPLIRSVIMTSFTSNPAK